MFHGIVGCLQVSAHYRLGVISLNLCFQSEVLADNGSLRNNIFFQLLGEVTYSDNIIVLLRNRLSSS